MKFLKFIMIHFSMGLRLKEVKPSLALVLCLLLIAGGPSMVGAEDEVDPAEQAGLGVASALLSLPYGPIKIVYAGLGGIVGGATWLITGGNTETARLIWEPSFYGDYVITPDHIIGNKPLRFFGVPPYQEDPYGD